MNPIRYLLDENVDSALRSALLKREPEIIVWKVGDPGGPSKGTKDPEVLDWCEMNSFLLITNNRASMPNHLADHIRKGGHIPEIFQLNPNMNFGETVEELLLIWGASEPDEYRDLIIYLPLSSL
jgi:hypothetical protein